MGTFLVVTVSLQDQGPVRPSLEIATKADIGFMNET